MGQIKLVGRELSVVRAIEHEGSTGRYLHERTNIDADELLGILNGLSESGYVEPYLQGQHLPSLDPIPMARFHDTRFEINPSYYQEIKKILKQRL